MAEDEPEYGSAVASDHTIIEIDPLIANVSNGLDSIYISAAPQYLISPIVSWTTYISYTNRDGEFSNFGGYVAINERRQSNHSNIE